MKPMKIQTLYPLALGIGMVSISLLSCSRERIEPTQELNSYESINDYMDTKKQEEQVFKIDTSGTGPIQGNQGTKIWIAKELLMFPDSTDVEWPFTVKLVELYTPKDMIYYRMPTVAQGDILETEGEVRIRAFKADANGVVQELLLKPNRVFPIEMPSDSIRGNLKVYYGFQNGSYYDWTTNVTSIGGNASDLYFSATATGHSANIGKLGWVNCGAPHQGFHSLNFTSQTDELGHVGLFTFLPQTKALVQAYNQITDQMPDSVQIKVLALAINASNELFYTYKYATLTSSGTIDITLEPISENELTSILDNL